VPDVQQRDVFVAGSASFVHHVVRILERLSVPSESVHSEVYAL
jgi:ferredoxin-NADP reductase